jgi:protoporphyrin/coproporphyrin ferrochelatase
MSRRVGFIITFDSIDSFITFDSKTCYTFPAMKASEKIDKIAVILMTYGSPKNLDGVYQYLKNVYKGREPAKETIVEFKRRYEIIGGSPLIQITQNQAKALEKELISQFKGNPKFLVRAGMRFSEPFIKEVVQDVGQDADQIIGIIMSPQYSPIIMNGYLKETGQAVSGLGNKKTKLKVATDWHLEPSFIDALAEKVKKALEEFSVKERSQVPILFTAHSMPKKVIDREQGYINDLKETAAEVAKRLNLKKDQWLFCYQSAGHTPEEWLKPDFADIMPELAKKGKRKVLVVPVQFLADHLETLYDIDIGARQQAEENGIEFHRIESLNTSPFFIKALASVVQKNLS